MCASSKKTPRADGLETKGLILEYAGRLIAEKGFAATTSKDICRAAGLNTAAVNYHFGSRDALYVEVLGNVHDNILSMEVIQGLYAQECNAEARIEKFLDLFIHKLYVENDWRIKVWLREILSGNPLLNKVLVKTVVPKLLLINKLFSDYLELEPTDFRVHACAECIIAPFAMLVVSHQGSAETLLPEGFDMRQLIEQIKKNIMLSLRAQRAALIKG